MAARTMTYTMPPRSCERTKPSTLHRKERKSEEGASYSFQTFQTQYRNSARWTDSPEHLVCPNLFSRIAVPRLSFSLSPVTMSMLDVAPIRKQRVMCSRSIKIHAELKRSATSLSQKARSVPSVPRSVHCPHEAFEYPSKLCLQRGCRFHQLSAVRWWSRQRGRRVEYFSRVTRDFARRCMCAYPHLLVYDVFPMIRT